MAGRAAEVTQLKKELILGKDLLTAGCSNDLQQATNLAYQYVFKLGMSEINLITSEYGH